MRVINLAAGSYDLVSRPASVQRSVNLMPVPLEPGNERTGWVLKDVPGLTSFSSIVATVYDVVISTPSTTTVTVPAGVTSALFSLVGPGGGAGLTGTGAAPNFGARVGKNGGFGGLVEARLTVVPGQVLEIISGGPGEGGRSDSGSPNRGWPSPGPQVSATGGSGAGGGYSAVINQTLAVDLLYAAGGAGGGSSTGNSSAGGGGGTNTGQSSTIIGLAGTAAPTGGTQVAAGAGGAVPFVAGYEDGGAGSGRLGGIGAGAGVSFSGGGGGGGGYWGGGGGYAVYVGGSPAEGPGGAGGSNFVIGSALSVVANTRGGGGAGGVTGAGSTYATSAQGLPGSVSILWNG